MAARRLKIDDAEQGWQALVACIQRPHWTHGEFTQLDLLTSGAWDEELQTRPEAAALVARMIALRGGDVEGDLAQLQRLRLPLFTLAAAMKQPEVYKGRYLLLRGQLEELRTEGAATTAILHETSLRATAHERDVGNRWHTTDSTRFSSAHTFRNGSATSSSSGARSSETYATNLRYDNEKVDTGRVALGRLPRVDPFLEPQQEFLFLARFDALRASAAMDEKPVAVLTIVGYYRPNALVIE